MPDRMKLTLFGEFVNQHSVMTPPEYWRRLLKEVDRIADEDGDFELMLEERAMGMLEMVHRYYQFTNAVEPEPCGATSGPPDHIYGTCNRPRGHVNIRVSFDEYCHCEMRDGRIWAEWRGSLTPSEGSSDTDTSESSTE